MANLLITRPAPGVVLLTLNRPEAMNAIDMALAEALFSALDAFEQDSDARVLVLTGAGGQAFSAGFDIREMAGFDAAAMQDAFERRDPLMLRIAECPKPVIAALNGITYGAGALMAAAADIRVASRNMRFRVTAASYGSANATWSLPALVGGAKAKELLMTARVVGGEEALAIGLVNALVEPDALMEAALDMASAIAANPPEGVAGVKTLINKQSGASMREGWTAEFEWMRAQLAAGARPGQAVFANFLEGRDD